MAMTGVIFLYAGRRAAGTPLTWGEAYAGALFVFGLLVVAYAILPSQWLSYADNAVRWRSDEIGIPTGPLHYLPWWPKGPGTAYKVHVLGAHWHGRHGGPGKLLWFIPTDKGLLWPQGLTFFGRGKVVI